MIAAFVYLICYTNILLITPQDTHRQQKRDAVLFVIKEWEIIRYKIYVKLTTGNKRDNSREFML